VTTTAEAAQVVVRTLAAQGLTIAVAESLTGGLVLAELTGVPGASTVVRGGSVVYMTDTKHAQLGVPADLLATRGPVDRQVAEAMATSVRDLWGADLGVATTGVAGPDPQDDHPVGEVHLALAHASDVRSEQLALTGDRATVRRLTVEAALALVAAHLAHHGSREASVGGRGYTEVTQGEERR
jgi:nicotinamide-nucleotide amidase